MDGGAKERCASDGERCRLYYMFSSPNGQMDGSPTQGRWKSMEKVCLAVTEGEDLSDGASPLSDGSRVVVARALRG